MGDWVKLAEAFLVLFWWGLIYSKILKVGRLKLCFMLGMIRYEGTNCAICGEWKVS